LGIDFLYLLIQQFYNNALTHSYFKLNEMIHDVFPALDENEEYRASEDFNQVNYWRINYAADEKFSLDLKTLIK